MTLQRPCNDPATAGPQPGGRAAYLPNTRYLSLPTKPNLVTPGCLDDLQHLGRQVIACQRLRLELQFGLGLHGGALLQDRDQVAFGDRRSVPQDLFLRGQHQLVLDRFDDDRRRVRLRLRKVDVDRVRRDRDGNDEHDQQNEQHVDQRRHVHVHHRLAVELASRHTHVSYSLKSVRRVRLSDQMPGSTGFEMNPTIG